MVPFPSSCKAVYEVLRVSVDYLPENLYGTKTHPAGRSESNKTL